MAHDYRGEVIRRTRLLIPVVLLLACSDSKTRGVDTTGASTDTARGAAASMIAAMPLRALGTEPFWALDIESSQVRFRTPDDTAGVVFPAPTRTLAGDTVRWSTQRDTLRIEARVWPGTCSDGMSDRQYPYTASVMFTGTIYSGCADRRDAIAR